jgi:hypothetical protein
MGLQIETRLKIKTKAVWRNGIASDYEVRETPNQEIAGSTPVSVIFFFVNNHRPVTVRLEDT